MKNKFFLLAVFFMFIFFVNSASAQISSRNSQLITKINDSTIKFYEQTIVPKGQVYFLYNEKKELVATVKEGNPIYPSHRHAKKENVNGNCVRIPCPKGFNNVNCWECHPK